MNKRLTAIILALMMSAAVRGVGAAGPYLYLSPASSTVTNGTTFTVSVGVDSGVEKSTAVDAFLTFDKDKLEVVSVDKAANPPFVFNVNQAIHNETGKFEFNCISDTNPLEATAVKGDLVVVTFRAKATGVATVGFTCAAGITTDSNISNTNAVDVIDCGSNQGGSYTINAGTGGDTTAAAPTAVPLAQTTGELPKTGAIETTLGLLIFGAVSIFSSMMLKFL